MKSTIKITPTIALGWLLTLSMIIAAVTPVLPPETPHWLHTALGIAAVVIAAILQSALKLPPTVPEAVAVIEGSAAVTTPDTPREGPGQ